MKLRTKVLLTIVLTFLGLSAALFFISQSVLLGSFKELEKKSVARNVGRAVSALDAEIKGLDSLNLDWGSWDDSYRFAVDGNSGYIRSNLNIETLIKQRLNLIIFLDSSCKVVFARALSHETSKEVSFPQDLMPHISPGSPFVTHNDLGGGHDGLIVIRDAVMMASSRPILTSEGKGPARGTIIMGRYLDEEEVRRLAVTTLLDVRFSRYDEKLAAGLEKKAGRRFSSNGNTLTHAVSDETISGYGIVNDIYHKPALMVRLDLPREIYSQGRASILYFIVYLLAAAVVSAAAIMLILKKSVLSRLSALGSQAVDIGKSGNLSERVDVRGGDELAGLAMEVNRMLESLEDLEAARKSAQDDLRKARDELEVRSGSARWSLRKRI